MQIMWCKICQDLVEFGFGYYIPNIWFEFKCDAWVHIVSCLPPLRDKEIRKRAQ